MNWLDKILVRLLFSRRPRHEQRRYVTALKILVPLALLAAAASGAIIYFLNTSSRFTR